MLVTESRKLELLDGPPPSELLQQARLQVRKPRKLVEHLVSLQEKVVQDKAQELVPYCV
jgi:hypothetical protein